MADRIVIMRDGRIRQVGTPAQVYFEPADTFVAQFIGAPSMNLLPGHAAEGAVTLAGGGRIAAPSRAAGPVTLGVRPEDLKPADAADAPLVGVVSVAEPLGAGTLLYVDVGGVEVIASAPGRGAPGPGARIGLAPTPGTVHLFDAVTGIALR